jgi:hypothetical protein
MSAMAWFRRAGSGVDGVEQGDGACCLGDGIRGGYAGLWMPWRGHLIVGGVSSRNQVTQGIPDLVQVSILRK